MLHESPTHKTGHEKHKAQLSPADRFADSMRNVMGSWPFVIGFLVFMGIWIGSNGLGIDPAPYGRLNLALSAMAGIQASLIMIAAKRLDQMAAAQSKHDYEVNLDADKRIKEVQNLQVEMHKLVQEVHKSLARKKK